MKDNQVSMEQPQRKRIRDWIWKSNKTCDSHHQAFDSRFNL